MLRFPGLAAALAVGALLLAAAAASYPLFLSATASDLVNAGIAKPSITRYGAGMLLQSDNVSFAWTLPSPGGPRPAPERMGDVFARLAGRRPELGPVVTGVMSPAVAISAGDGAAGTRPARLFASTDVLEHVRIVSGTDGSGAWLPELIADALHVGPGDRVSLTFGSGPPASVVVDGVYRDLYARPLSGYWLAWDTDLIQRDPDAPPLPQPIFVDPGQLLSLSQTLGIPTAKFSWQAPLEPGIELTLDRARSLGNYERALSGRISNLGTPLGRLFHCCYSFALGGLRNVRFITNLSGVVTDVDRRLEVISGPGRLVQTAGLAVALVVVGAAGAFALGARRSEIALLLTRGTGPTAVAARTALESLIPCTVGGAAGLALTLLSLRTLGPSGPIASGAMSAALLAVAGAVATSVILLGAVAAVRYLRESEHHRARLALLAEVPWEIGLLVLAYLAWRRLDAGGALTTDDALGVQRPSLLLIVFPLLLLSGVGLLAARLFQVAARAARARSDRFPSPAYLAVRRIAGGSRLVMALVAASALALGVFVQSQAMVRSLRSTVAAKARVFVGSDVQARIDYGNVVPSEFPFPMTRVVRLPSAGTLSDGRSFDLLAVDPATLPEAAYWNGTFAARPLRDVVHELGAAAAGGALPVVLAGTGSGGVDAIEIDQQVMPVRVVETASAFPGMVSLRPLVVVAERRFLGAFEGTFNPLDVAQASTELWVRGEPGAVEDALSTLGFPIGLILSAEEVEDIPYITAVIDTFVVLNVLGLAAALLVLAGMLMYLQARERSQVVSYGLSLRMGMSHVAHRRALVSELASMLGSSFVIGALLAMGISALVVPLLDPLPVIPPGPLFVSPVVVTALAGVGVLLAAWVGGWITNAWARRIDLGEVMRLAE